MNKTSVVPGLWHAHVHQQILVILLIIGSFLYIILKYFDLLPISVDYCFKYVMKCSTRGCAIYVLITELLKRWRLWMIWKTMQNGA